MLLFICPATVNADSVTGSVTVRLGAYEVSASNISYYSATISWKTNGNATSQVFYDTASHDNITDYAYQTSESLSLVLAHSVSLTGLASGTTYHYRVKSRIPETDFIAVSDDYTFTTLTPSAEEGEGGGEGPPPPPPPPGTIPVSDIVTTDGVFTKAAIAESFDKLCHLTIDKGTKGLTKEKEPLTQISIEPMTTPPSPPAETNVIGLTYDFGPDAATFDPPVTITLSYDPTKIPGGVNEKDLVLAFYDKATGQWVTLSDIIVDPVTHTISGKTSHFTAISVIAYTRPAAFTISALTISPTEVKVGESVSINVNIANTGDIAGNYNITLKINNIVVETKQVSLTGHASQKVTFTTSRDAAGSYAVSINTLSGAFTVKAVPTTIPTPTATPALTPIPTPAPTDWGLIGGLIAAAIVIIGLLVYFLIRRRASARR